MGRQSAENLHRDSYQKDISKDRWGDREQRSYIGISRKRERGREQRSEQQISEDRWGQIVENLHRDFSKEREGKKGKEQ